MQRNSTVQNRQTISGYLATLYLRHDQASTHYTQVANAINGEERDDMRTMTKSLAGHHSQRATFLKELIDDSPPIPVKPNTQMKTETEDVAPHDIDNDVALLKNYQHREEAILTLYKEMLDNDGIPEGYYEKLQKVSEKTQEVVRKLQRTISSGSVERDMTV